MKTPAVDSTPTPAMTRYLAASDLAALCEVDIKTIYNWTNFRGLPHFKTPGRHRRFKAREVAPWLRAQGYDVPVALAIAEIEDQKRAKDEAAQIRQATEFAGEQLAVA